MTTVAPCIPGADSGKPVGVARSLAKANNDTGRIAYCGPYVLSAITGAPISAVEDAFRRVRAAGSGSLVKGTSAEEVGRALAMFGYGMERVASYLDLDRRARPTVWSWMQKPRKPSAFYILAIHRGREGHWILIKGVVLCDTYTQGAWTFVCDGPHRGARIMEVYAVAKAAG